MTKPTDKPEFAKLDQTDPTSGQNNVIEPPTAWKDYGWSYQEKPPRNYFNWLHRLSYEWINWIDDAIQRPFSFVVAASDAPAIAKEAANYVCDGTNDEVEISAAIQAAYASTAGGGTVLLTEGAFVVDGAITLKTGVNLIGLGESITVIKVDATATSNFYVLNGTDVGFVTIANLYIDGNSPQPTFGHTGIYIGGVAPITGNEIFIYNVRVGNIDTHAESLAGHGIVIEAGTHQHIINCRIDSNKSNGIHIAGTTTQTFISNCYVRNNALIGIYTSTEDTTISNNHVAENAINIAASAGTRTNIINNLALSSTSAGGGAGIYVTNNSTDIRIQGNDVRSNDGQGIFAETADFTTIKNNYVQENGDIGIKLTTSDYCNVSENMVKGNYTDGIVLDTVESSIVQGNFAYENSTGPGLDTGIDIQSCVDCHITDNTVRGVTNHNYGMQLGSSSTCLCVDNDLRNASISPVNNLSGTGKTNPDYIWDQGLLAHTLNNILLANKITTDP